jgi:formylmethanofuran dehydrogenase subunit B
VADFGPVTCAGCGLLCDDVTVERPDGGLRLQPPCRLGVQWFAERLRRPAGKQATISGQPAEVEAALTQAAGLLRRSRRPLLYGFEGATVEDARAAVALADRLKALIATESVSADWPGAPAAPLRGTSTATLGEIRDRARLVIIWREDPETTHPRLLERIGFDRGAYSGLGGKRTLLVVDDRDTTTARRADLHLRWGPERDLDALITLHAMQRRGSRRSDIENQHMALLEHISGVPHVAFVYGGGLTTGAGGQRRALVLHELVRTLCRERRVVTLALPPDSGTTGAQDVLAWQTGYGSNVDLASGHPELVTTSQPLAAHEGVDVALRVEGARARLPAGVAEIALCSAPVDLDVEISIRTAAAGVEAAGTAHRLDGVPLALQAPFAGDAPTAAALLAQLLTEIER